jgi:hypothetical protein
VVAVALCRLCGLPARAAVRLASLCLGMMAELCGFGFGLATLFIGIW